MPTDAEGTKFEQDLKNYFPEIYDLYVYGKADPKVWEVVYSLVDMWKQTSHGRVIVMYRGGKINYAACEKAYVFTPMTKGSKNLTFDDTQV